MELPTPTWSDIIKRAIEYRASDILLAQNQVYFKRGSESVAVQYKLTPDWFEHLGSEVTSCNLLVDKDFTYEGRAGASDFSWSHSDRRFRVNKFKTNSGTSFAIRPLSPSIPTMEMVGFSKEVIQALETKRQGLIIVTGPTGSGKSTALAAMIEYLNARHPLNIISIEDPIEYLYSSKRSVVQQREVGRDVGDFSTAVRSAMRESPDVILVGEIRDYHTLKACLQAAETGHLVFATLHTKGVASTLMRMLDMAPANERSEVSAMLASSYQMVIYQKLIFFNGQYLTIREVLLPHAGVRNCLRTGTTAEVNNIIQMSQTQGMISWDGDIKRHLAAGHITEEIAKSLKDQI